MLSDKSCPEKSAQKTGRSSFAGVFWKEHGPIFNRGPQELPYPLWSSPEGKVNNGNN